MSIMTLDNPSSIHPFFSGRSSAIDDSNGASDTTLSAAQSIGPPQNHNVQVPSPSSKPRRGRPPKSACKSDISGDLGMPQVDGPAANKTKRAPKKHPAPVNWLNGQPLKLASANSHALGDQDSFPEPQDRKRRKIEPDQDANGIVRGGEDTDVHDVSALNKEPGLNTGQVVSTTPASNIAVSVVIPASSPRRIPSVHDYGSTSSPVDVVPASSPPAPQEGLKEQKETNEASQMPSATLEQAASPPRRVLQLKNGKFASPKSKRSAAKDEKDSPNAKRKRSRKTIIVILRYNTESIGPRILEIINRVPQPKADAEVTRSRGRKVTNENSDPSKPTHPFFAGKDANAKTKAEAAPTLPSPRKTSACTPGKLRAEVAAHRLSMQPVNSGPVFGSSRPLGGPRQVGLKEAVFPTKDMTHVRGLEASALEPSQPYDNDQIQLLGRRKGKQLRPDVAEEESVVHNFGRNLALSTPVRQIDDQSRQLFNPVRTLMTSDEIRKMAQTSLKVELPFNEAKLRQPSTNRCAQPHAALTKLYNDFQDFMSPFDRFECETQTWTAKYRPTAAEHVLQSGPEALILRDWLKRCTINAVQTSSKRSVTSMDSGITNKGKAKVGRPKKRRKTTELDDFIVGSEDEADELEDFEEIMRDVHTRYNPSNARSTIRGGLSMMNGKRAKTATTIVLSGPHGCGKTASIYAVAKELGFEVFEINSGSRRSGKDILDKIGNMTENHLVQHVAKALAKPESNETTKPIDVVEKSEEEGPKQNKLASFFTKTKKDPSAAKPAEKLLTPEKPKAATPKKPKAAADNLVSRPRQQQKQSLILFEEVDILFDEDKQFWLTVLTLAINSKRPIIITCTDESVVPIEALTLHAILRFVPPPIDLAADYMILLAAREGHLLDRVAVESLYNSRNYDLRACITDLDFWCQLGVGDNKGGLEWLLQRWPPGSDLNEQGQTLRVTSTDTYRAGLGWSGDESDATERIDSLSEASTARLTQLRSEWNITGEDLGDTGWDLPGLVAKSNKDVAPSSLTQLEDLCTIVDHLSAADQYCDMDPHLLLTRSIDSATPPITDKKRASYTSGQTLLQDDLPTDVTTTRELLACAMLPVQNTYWKMLEGRTKASIDPANHPLRKGSTNAIFASLYRKTWERPLARTDFSRAFDTLAECPMTNSAAHGNAMLMTSFDREFGIITTDLAPYVRIIAKYDQRLEAQRLQLSNLLSEGGISSQGSNKKARTTRASRSALEGGKRATTRRERWFDQDVNLKLVLETGGKDWAGLGAKDPATDNFGTDVNMRVSDDELSASQG